MAVEAPFVQATCGVIKLELASVRSVCLTAVTSLPNLCPTHNSTMQPLGNSVGSKPVTSSQRRSTEQQAPLAQYEPNPLTNKENVTHTVP